MNTSTGALPAILEEVTINTVTVTKDSENNGGSTDSNIRNSDNNINSSDNE